MTDLFSALNQKGLRYVIDKVIEKAAKRKVQHIDTIQNALKGQSGLEIGGPSRVFQSEAYIPVYPVIKALDGCNFSNTTLWEGEISSAKYEYEPGKEGHQYISDATDLSGIENEKYDFIISSHCLEHVANPIKALKEWQRVLKMGGHLLVVVPYKKYIFDHKRPFTSFDHILQDFNNEIGEDDQTHLKEVLRLHDLKRDPLAGTIEQFKERSLNNFENRALHQHVFSLEVLKNMFEFLNIEVLSLSQSSDHLVIFGKK